MNRRERRGEAKIVSKILRAAGLNHIQTAWVDGEGFVTDAWHTSFTEAAAHLEGAGRMGAVKWAAVCNGKALSEDEFKAGIEKENAGKLN